MQVFELTGCKPVLRGLRIGPDGGQPILALHGWLDNAASFAVLEPWLTGFQLVAIDLPGHGQSGHRSEDASYHFVDYVPAVLDAADQLGMTQFHLLGHSMGAGIAAVVAAVFTRRVLSVAALEGLVPLPEEDDGPVARLRNYFAARARRAQAAGSRKTRYASVAEAEIARRAAGDFAPGAVLTPMVERALQGHPPALEWSSDPRLRMPGPFRFTSDQIRQIVRSIACPVQMIMGERGMFAGSSDVALLAGEVAGIQQVTIPGGHHIHFDQPQRVAGLLETFWRNLPPQLPAPAHPG